MLTEDVRDRPSVTPDQAREVAQAHFGLDVASISELASERDRNFRVTRADGQSFVLKFAHPAADRELLECQNALLDHLAAKLPQHITPRVMASRTGAKLVDVASGELTLAVRLLEYLPGEVFASVSPHSPTLLHSLGATLAEVDQALTDFNHPAATRDFVWDLRQGEASIADNLLYIAEPAHRELIEHFALRFSKSNITNRLSEFRQSIIHSDANDYNVLVRPARDDEAKTLELEIAGLLDFGDIVRTALICEVAIAAAYSILGKDEPLAAACHVIAGYHHVLPLEEAEVAALYDLICLRLCVSVCMSAKQSQQATDNAYLLVSQQPALATLQQLREIHPHWAEMQFRRACGWEPNASSGQLRNWMEAHSAEFAHVLPADLMTGARMTFDLSVASRDFESFEEMADPERLADTLFARMRAANKPLAIGRWDEPRTLYASEVFAPADNPHGEWRTIHIGVDLFAEAGTPVFAPLPGVIHSVQDNANPLDYGPTIILRHEVTGDDGNPLTFWTLYGHLSRESLQGKQPGQHIAHGEQIATFGDLDVNGGWPPHLHFQVMCDALDATGDFPGVGRASDREVWRSLCPNPAALLRLPEEEVTFTETPTSDLKADRLERLGRNLSLSYAEPLRIVRGHRQFLLSNAGRRFLDCVNNVAHVGHCHPRVVEAARRQLGVLNTNTRYLHENIINYAEALTSTFPDPLEVCFFVNSGSEANDLALRMAEAASGSKHVIAVDHAYHGNLSSLIDISGYKCNGPGGQGPGEFTHVVQSPDVYRGPYSAPNAGEEYAASVTHTITKMLEHGPRPGAFICESILSCGGQIVLPSGYLRHAYAAVRSAGGVCIADEVQVGFGRVGEAFWAFELQGVVPDIVTLGKPIGNGHALGAVVTTRKIADAFCNGMEYFNTFGGNPVSCAVGQAVLNVIHEEGLQAHAREVGNKLFAGLRELQTQHEIIGDVRGHGLFLGIEFVTDCETKEPAARQASYIVERMKSHGILLSTDGPLHNVIKIKPPLCFDARDAERLVTVMDQVLAETPIRRL